VNQATRPPYILVVDDDHQLCDVLVELLTEVGYLVRCAYDGEAGWVEIQARSPDLILSDITMPRLDGQSLALRLAEAGSGIPIILMSAGPHDGARVHGPFVRKPFAIDVLLACIARTLEETDTARAPIPH
jgi:two-component system response regulator MprA